MGNAAEKYLGSFEKTSPGFKEDLLRLTEEMFGGAGQRRVSEFLERGDVESAQTYLLGALDALVARGEIPSQEAREKYKILDLKRMREQFAKQATK